MRTQYHVAICLLLLIVAMHACVFVQAFAEGRFQFPIFFLIFAFVLVATFSRKRVLLRLSRIICYTGLIGNLCLLVVGVFAGMAIGLVEFAHVALFGVVYALMFLVGLAGVQEATKIRTKEPDTPAAQ